MIIIQTESGAIVTDPKEIYIDKDLDGNLHLYADLSNTDRIKAVKLTVFDYSKEDLGQMLEKLYQKMDDWLFMSDCPHYVTSMKEVLDMAKQERMEVSHD
nr:MAG TPA: hypothetical protein [Caudoviricetes sp.]